MASSVGSGTLTETRSLERRFFGEFHRVALIGFDPVAGACGDERGGDHIALASHLNQAAGDPETASAGFIANVKIGEFALL